MAQRRFRISIAWLMMAVLAFGVCVAAVRQSTPAWGVGFFSSAIAVLAVISLAAGIGRKPAFVGASIFGWAYFILVFGPWCESRIRPRLVTTILLELVERRLSPPELRFRVKYLRHVNSLSYVSKLRTIQQPNVPAAYVTSDRPVTWSALVTRAQPGKRTVVDLSFDRRAFHRIGQTLWTFAFAGLGAGVGRLFAARQDENRRLES
jgi:hypothetical protein